MTREDWDIINALPSVDLPAFKAAAKAAEAQMRRRKRVLVASGASERARLAGLSQ
jgi:hypothetical protein